MTVLRCGARPNQRLTVDESTESTQRFQRESRDLHERQGGRARLRHPSWKQSPGTVELIDDEVIAVNSGAGTAPLSGVPPRADGEGSGSEPRNAVPGQYDVTSGSWTDEDLAIGLSRTYRWGGYSAWDLPLSVAQHSLTVLALATRAAGRALTPAEALRELLHEGCDRVGSGRRLSVALARA